MIEINNVMLLYFLFYSSKMMKNLTDNQKERIEILNLYFYIDLSNIITNYAGNFIPPVDFAQILKNMELESQSKKFRNKSKVHRTQVSKVSYYIYGNLMYNFKDYIEYKSILQSNSSSLILEENILQMLENYMNSSKIIQQFKNDKNPEIITYIKNCKPKTLMASACKLLDNFKTVDEFFQEIVDICQDLRYGDFLETDYYRNNGLHIVLKDENNKYILKPIHNSCLPIEAWPILKSQNGDFFEDIEIYCIERYGKSYIFNLDIIQEKYDLIIDDVKLAKCKSENCPSNHVSE